MTFVGLLRFAGTLAVLSLSAIASVFAAAPAAAQETVVSIRVPYYHECCVDQIEHVRDRIFRVNEGDSRAIEDGVVFNICADPLQRNYVSFDIEIGGTATQGVDYELFARDVRSSEFPTRLSSRASYRMNGVQGLDCVNIGFKIINDAVDELRYETITFEMTNFDTDVDKHRISHSMLTIEIRENDNDVGTTFHTLPSSTLPAVLSEDLFGRERGTGNYSFDPSKEFVTAARNLPKRGESAIEIRFSGTAEFGVDYFVFADRADDTSQGFVLRSPTRSRPTLVWTTWKNGQDERRMKFRIKVVDDNIEEDTESIIIDFNPGNLQFDGVRGEKRLTLRIFDNDRPAPAASVGATISTSPTSISEELNEFELASPDNFHSSRDIRLSIPSQSVTLSLSFTVGGTATRCDDYVFRGNLFAGDGSGASQCDSRSTTGVFRINPRTTSYILKLKAIDDSFYEADDETIIVNFGEDSRGNAVTGRIGLRSDDDFPVISIASARATEGDPGDFAVLSYEVSVDGESEQTITFVYEVSAASTASSTGDGKDFTQRGSSSISFESGETTKDIEVAIDGDNLAEVDETVILTLSHPVNAEFENSATTVDVTGTIVDDDLLELSISDASVEETDENETSILTFTVELGADTPEPVSVEYMVTGGSDDGEATEGVDFVATTGTLMYDPGDPLMQTFEVTINGDVIFESHETLTATLTNPQCGGCPAGVTVSLKSDENTAVGTILDNEGVQVSISNPTVEEGNTGEAHVLVFNVTLSRVGVQPITVDYSVLSTGSAESGTDFAPPQDTMLEFDNTAGEVLKTITVSVTGDVLYEEDETVLVELSNLTGEAQFSVSTETLTGRGTITNDDALPLLTISSTSEDEGDAGGTTVLQYEVRKTGATALPVMVDYAISDSSTATATGDGMDFTYTSGSPLTFAVNETIKMFEVAVVGDEILEEDEEVVVVLSGPVNAGFVGEEETISATGTIRNDDEMPLLAFGAVPSITEGDPGGTTMLRFEVTKEGETALPATVSYSFGGTATSSGNDADYTHSGSSLTIPVDQESAFIDVVVSGDDLAEQEETVIVTLASPDNARFAGGMLTIDSTGVVANDDFLRVSVEAEDIAEGSPGSVTPLIFTATLEARSSQPVTVSYEVITTGAESGTAIHGAGADYTATIPTGTLTFDAGTAAPQVESFEVTVHGDNDRELDETVVARLHGLSRPAEFSEDSSAPEVFVTGTILNDENPTFSVGAVRVDEGEAGETAIMTFEITLSRASEEVVTVDYRVTGGTEAGQATAGEDFHEVSDTRTLTFNPVAGNTPGETVKSVTVEVIGDDFDEMDEETVTLTLSDASPNAFIRTAEWIGVIVDDDEPPVFSIDSPSVDEGDSELVDLVFTVSKTGGTRLDSSVAFAVTDGTAIGGEGNADDYALLTSSQLDFAPSERTKQITVQVRGDSLAETDETVIVTLSSPVQAVLDSSGMVGTGTIANDDDLVLSIDSPDAPELDNGETSEMIFTVTLEAETPADISVDYEVTGGTSLGLATAGVDFTAIAGILTFTTGGDLTKEIVVTVTGDVQPEGREIMTATLSNLACGQCPTGVAPRLGTDMGTGVILDNEAISISVNDPSVFEGNSGDTTTLDFEVTLDYPWHSDVTVNYSILAEGGNAVAGMDFESLPDGVLTFSSSQNEISKTITVNIIGNDRAEDNKTVVIELSGATGGAIFIGGTPAVSSTGTILNDDYSYNVEASPSSVTEPDSGAVELTFTVTLTPAPSSAYTVRYVFGGTAAEGFDFTDATQSTVEGALAFEMGESINTIRTLVHSDFVAEEEETVEVSLVDEDGTPFESASATATIQPPATNVDSITLEVASPQVVVVGSDGSPQVEFELLLSAIQESDVMVKWVLGQVTTEEVDSLEAGPFSRAVRLQVTVIELAKGTVILPVGDLDTTARSALMAGTDLSSIEGQLVIEIGRPTGVDGIEIQQAAGITAPVQAAVDAKGRVAAAVFDAPDAEPAPTNERPTFSIAGPAGPVVEPETATATVDLEFTVRLAPVATGLATVRYSFGGTATEGADYTDETTVPTKGVLEFAAGDTRKIIMVRVNSDFVADEEETITVTLSNARGASIDAASRTATVTIEPAASTATAAKLSVSMPAVANSEDDGNPIVTFNLHLDVAQSVQVTVMWVLNEARDGVVHRKLASGSAALEVNSTTEEISRAMDDGITLGSIRGQLLLEMERPSDAGVEIEQDPDIDADLQAEARSNNRVVVIVFSAGSRSRDWATTSALSGFGRSAAVSLVNTIWSRTEAHRQGGASSFVSLGGRSVDVSAYSPGADARGAAKETARVLGLEAVSASSSSAGWFNGEPQVSGDLDDFMRWASLPDSERIAKESSFALALGEGSTDGSSFVYWGAASNGSFGSELEHDDGEFSDLKTDGSTTTISLGFDYRMSESILLGLAVSSVSGSVEYSFAESDEKGELTPSLTGFTPWLRWQSSAGLEVWGAVGIGSGSAESNHSGDTLEMDLSSQTIAVGIWNRIASFGSVGVAAKADVVMASLSADGAGDAVDDAGADSQRIRVAAEMTPGDSNSASRTTSYSFEVGARQDGGEAESGVGVDAAGNFVYTSPDGGLRISGRGSLVVFHGQEGFSETGFGLGFSYDPGGDGRGLQLSLEPTWNAPHTNAAGSMWNADTSNSLSQSSAQGVMMRTRLSYGVDFARTQALATLYGESEAGMPDRRLRLGAELRGEGGSLGPLRFDIYGEREENPSSYPENAIMLETSLGL